MIRYQRYVIGIFCFIFTIILSWFYLRHKVNTDIKQAQQSSRDQIYYPRTYHKDMLGGNLKTSFIPLPGYELKYGVRLLEKDPIVSEKNYVEQEKIWRSKSYTKAYIKVWYQNDTATKIEIIKNKQS